MPSRSTLALPLMGYSSRTPPMSAVSTPTSFRTEM
uniref:Uncharacterized protein n=1 Tax=Anguilla anguilla TaxID=7936 RepID=A0A0E9RE16_ANGAN